MHDTPSHDEAQGLLDPFTCPQLQFLDLATGLRDVEEHLDLPAATLDPAEAFLDGDI